MISKKIFFLIISLGLAATLVACGDSGSNADDASNSDEKSSEKSSEKSETKKVFGQMGTMVDPRDGTVYQTIQIGRQLWMAENLTFYDSIWNPKMASWENESYCSHSATGIVPIVSSQSDEESYSCKYKYTYNEAMNFDSYDDSLYNDGICPPGWHLPTMDEFDDFKSAINAKCDSITYCNLKEHGWSESDEYWTSVSADYGVRIESDYGFSFERNSNMAVYYSVDLGGYKSFEADFSFKSNRLHVRCVQGSKADSIDALKDFLETREKNIAEKQAAEAQLAYDINGAKNYFNENLEYSYFTDERDSNVYGYIKIGNYTWMAENLKYLFDGSQGLYNHSDSTRFYTIGNVYTFDQVDSACPAGWHVSSAAEWDDLIAAAGSVGNLMAANFNWAPSSFAPTNSTGFTMIASSWNSDCNCFETSKLNEVDFMTSSDSVHTKLRVDTIYTDIPLDSCDTDTLVADTVASADTVAADSAVVSDSLTNVPTRSFTLDTTYKETIYHISYEYSWFFESFSKERGSLYEKYSVRCVMDY